MTKAMQMLSNVGIKVNKSESKSQVRRSKSGKSFSRNSNGKTTPASMLNARNGKKFNLNEHKSSSCLNLKSSSNEVKKIRGIKRCFDDEFINFDVNLNHHNSNHDTNESAIDEENASPSVRMKKLFNLHHDNHIQKCISTQHVHCKCQRQYSESHARIHVQHNHKSRYSRNGQQHLMRGKENNVEKISPSVSRKKLVRECLYEHHHGHHHHPQQKHLNQDGLEVSVSSIKQWHKEHLQLQRSFTTLCQSFNEAATSQRPETHFSNAITTTTTQCQQREMQEVDGINRQIELLTLELQESYDQNELLEFRILELEQFQSQAKVVCVKCSELEKQLVDARNEIQKLRGETINIEVRTKLELSEGKEEKPNLRNKIEEEPLDMLIRDDREDTVDGHVHDITIKETSVDTNRHEEQVIELRVNEFSGQHQDQNVDSQSSRVSVSDNASSAMTSEDEGLGDDTRRDHSSGPSSLADLQESECDITSSCLSNMCILDTPLSNVEKCTQRGGNGNVIQGNVTNGQSGVHVAESVEEHQQQHEEHNQVLSKSAYEKSKTNTKCASTNTSHSLKNVKSQEYIEQLEEGLALVKEEKANLVEQVLELEEAENDARLLSQRLQKQVDIILNQYETILLDLNDVKTTIDTNIERRINALEMDKNEIKEQLNEMKNELLKFEMEYVNGNSNSNHAPSSNCGCNKDNAEDKRHYKHDALIERIITLEKDEKSLQDQLQIINGLSCSLWEKLYKIEKEINLYCNRKACKCKPNASHTHQCNCASRDQVIYTPQQQSLLQEINNDEDLQLFMPLDKISQNSGCSTFDATSYDRSTTSSVDKHEHKYQLNNSSNNKTTTTQVDDLVVTLPLCETVKPERIDVTMNSPKIKPINAIANASSTSPAEIIERINKLETNEHQLKDRLMELEWINKEFVKELELRETIFMERQDTQLEWRKNEKELSETIVKLLAEREELQVKVNELEVERESLKEQISCHQSALALTKKEHENEIIEAKRQHEIAIENMQRRMNELESKEHDCALRMHSQEWQTVQSVLTNLKLNYEELKEELCQERLNMTKLKEAFENDLANLTNHHALYEKELQERIDELEKCDASYEMKLKAAQERETSCKQLLDDTENELNKMRQTHNVRIKILEEEHKIVEQELKLKMQSMEQKTSMTVKQLETQRGQLYGEIIRLTENMNGNDSHSDCKEQVKTVRENISRLEEKVELIEVRQGEIVGEDNGKVDEAEVKRLRGELCAYKETLSKADQIVETLEYEYKQKIEELCASERIMKSRIIQLEENERRWKRLRKDKRQGQISDIVQQLIDSEGREGMLKEQIARLEASEKQYKQKMEELNCNFEKEMKEHDELASNVVELQLEIESLKKDLKKSLQVQDSLQEMVKETERYCSQREDEMHKKFKSLEDEKCGLEIRMYEMRHRDRRYHELNSNESSDESPLSLPSINGRQLSSSSSPSLSSSSPTNEEEVNDACMHMEKCLKRAMVVVQMEMNQKSEINNKSCSSSCVSNCMSEVEHAFSSLSSPSPVSSSEDSDKCDSERCDKNETTTTTTTTTITTDNSLSCEYPIVKPQLPADKPTTPTNFRIIRQVGSDSLLVGWDHVIDNHVIAYQITLNHQVIQQVRHPDVNKVLIEKMDLTRRHSLSLCSVSFLDKQSQHVTIWFNPIGDNHNDNCHDNDDDSNDDDIIEQSKL